MGGMKKKLLNEVLLEVNVFWLDSGSPGAQDSLQPGNSKHSGTWLRLEPLTFIVFIPRSHNGIYPWQQAKTGLLDAESAENTLRGRKHLPLPSERAKQLN